MITEFVSDSCAITAKVLKLKPIHDACCSLKAAGSAQRDSFRRLTDKYGTFLGDGPHVEALAVTFRDDVPVLLECDAAPGRFAWGFPGGLIKPGEPVAVAALQHLKKEKAQQALTAALSTKTNRNGF